MEIAQVELQEIYHAGQADEREDLQRQAHGVEGTQPGGEWRSWEDNGTGESRREAGRSSDELFLTRNNEDQREGLWDVHGDTTAQEHLTDQADLQDRAQEEGGKDGDFPVDGDASNSISDDAAGNRCSI